MRPTYAVKRQSSEETLRWLRRKLALDKTPRRPRARPLKAIIAPVRLDPDELITGSEVVLFFNSGRRCPKIGKVIARTRTRVVLAAWGVSELETIGFETIKFFRLVGEHSWDERRRVSEFQRRRECAFLS